MNKVSLTRIKQLWGRQMFLEKMQILNIFITTACLLYVIDIIGIRYQWEANQYLETFYIFFCGSMAIYLSRTFAVLKTKKKRIAFLSLPATTAEKFITLTTWYIIVPVAIFAVAVLFNELPRALTVALMDDETQKQAGIWLLPRIQAYINYIPEGVHRTSTPEFVFAKNSFFYLLNIFLGSLFIFGSCLWYKYTFPKTIACIGTAMFLQENIRILLQQLLSNTGSTGKPIKDIIMFINTPSTGSFLFSDLLLLLGIIIVWYFCYHLFSRKEVISQEKSWSFRLLK